MNNSAAHSPARLRNLSSVIIRFSVLVFLCSLAFIQFFVSRGTRPARWSASSLQIPDKNAPWVLMTEIGDSYITLNIPSDLPAMAQLPSPVQQTLQRRIIFRNKNIEIMKTLSEDLEDILQQESFHRVPNYQRSMEEIVLAIDPADTQASNPLYKHEPILRHLPDYTVINIFAPENLVPSVRSQIATLALRNPVVIYPESIWESEENGIALQNVACSWTQDVFRVALNGKGQQYLFTPAAYLQFDDLSRPDLDYIQYLAGGPGARKVVRMPLFFRAGNILSGEIAGEHVLFIGNRALKFNAVSFFSALQYRPPNESMITLLKVTSGASKVRILPNSGDLFHLDMAMLILDDGIVAVIDPLDRHSLSDEDRNALEEIVRTLREDGFKVVFIPTTTSRIRETQSPVNAVVFVNRRNGHRYALVPEYPDVQVMTRSGTRSLNAMVKEIYEKNGVSVIYVEDRFCNKKGDLHCVLKVIN